MDYGCSISISLFSFENKNMEIKFLLVALLLVGGCCAQGKSSRDEPANVDVENLDNDEDEDTGINLPGGVVSQADGDDVPADCDSEDSNCKAVNAAAGNAPGAAGGSTARSFASLGGLVNRFPSCTVYQRKDVCYHYNELIPWLKRCPARYCWYRPRYAIYNGKRVKLYWNPAINHPRRILTTQCIYPNRPCHGQSCQFSTSLCPKYGPNQGGYCPRFTCQPSAYSRRYRAVILYQCRYQWQNVIVYYPRGCSCKPYKPRTCSCRKIKRPTQPPTIWPGPVWPPFDGDGNNYYYS